MSSGGAHRKTGSNEDNFITTGLGASSVVAGRGNGGVYGTSRSWTVVIVPETIVFGLLFCPFGRAIFPLPLAYSAAFGCVAAEKKRRAAGCNANPCHSLACRREIIPAIGGGSA